MRKSLRIAVLWRPGRNVELQSAYSGQEIPDDALEEAGLLCDGLSDAGHAAFLVRWRPDDLCGVLRELDDMHADLVFNASSASEVCFLHAAGIPYCGSGPDLVSTSKATRKKILAHDGIRTAPFAVVMPDGDARGSDVSVTDVRRGWEPRQPLHYPLFVKPVEGRGSAGVSDDSIVGDRASLLRQVEMVTGRMGQGALVENYLDGREVTVGVIGSPPEALLPLEIEYSGAKTNSFEHKMDREIMHCPPRMGGDEVARVKDVALRVFGVLGARDFARVDTIVGADGQPTVLEINTFAGLHILTGTEKHLHASYIGKMASAMGLRRGEVLGRIVESARQRYGT